MKMAIFNSKLSNYQRAINGYIIILYHIISHYISLYLIIPHYTSKNIPHGS